MTKICCPYCGTTPEQGFDCVEHEDCADDEIIDVYTCPKCKKSSARYYKYYAWEPRPKPISKTAGKTNAKPVRR